MIKIDFYVGREFTFDKKPISETDYHLISEAIEELLTYEYDGFTVGAGLGYYKDFPVEECTIYTVLLQGANGAIDPQNIERVASNLATVAQQETVLYTYSVVGGAFAKSIHV